MKRTTRWVFTAPLLGAALLLIDACGGTEPEAAEPYELVPIGTRDISVAVEAAGSVEPVMTVEVKSKASGEIFEMRVEVGDAVDAGDLLIRIDPRVPEASLRQAIADSILAQAELETAESQLRRVTQLHQTEAVTEVEYEDARLAVAGARASVVRAEQSVENARISAENTEVRAPISGVVITKRVEEGTVITSATGASTGSVLLQMANLDTVQVRSLVDETDIGRVVPGLQVTITVDAYPNRPFRGRVLKIEPQAEVSSNVTMFPVLVRIPNEEGLLKPGMNGEVEIQLGRRRQAVAVPNAALRTLRDFTSAATVLGLDPQAARQQLMADRPGSSPGDSAGRGMGVRRMRDLRLPEGVSEEDFRDAMATRRNEGEEALTESQRSILQRAGFAGGPAGDMHPGDAASQQQSSGSTNVLATRYIVFVMRDSIPTPLWIRTDLTDETYTEVVEGLAAGDTVIVLSGAGSSGTADDGPGMGGRGMGRGMGGGRPPRF